MSEKVVWFVFVSTLAEVDHWPDRSLHGVANSSTYSSSTLTFRAELMKVHEDIKRDIGEKLSESVFDLIQAHKM
jgi:hypothetical protein